MKFLEKGAIFDWFNVIMFSVVLSVMLFISSCTQTPRTIVSPHHGEITCLKYYRQNCGLYCETSKAAYECVTNYEEKNVQRDKTESKGNYGT
jgi:hypothetical protein